MLKRKKRGEKIAATEWNSLVDAAERILSIAPQRGVPYAPSFRSTFGRQWLNVFNDTGSDIEPYSVFGITDEAPSGGADDPPSVHVSQIGPLAGENSASIFLPLTNGAELIAADAYGVAWPIGMDAVTRLRFGDSEPQAGQHCGPAMDSLVIEASRVGFICIGPSSIDGCVDVVRSNGESIVGIVTDSVTAFVAPNRLGTGAVSLRVRGLVGSLLSAVSSPATTVYSVAASIFEVGDPVICKPVTGVGFVIECCVEGSESDESESEDEESESDSSAEVDCGNCEPGTASQCYRLDILGVLVDQGEVCELQWNNSFYVEADPTTPCVWNSRIATDGRWPCSEEYADGTFSHFTGWIQFRITQHGPAVNKQVKLSAIIGTDNISPLQWTDTVIRFSKIITYETEFFDCDLENELLNFESYNGNNSADWTAATLRVTADICGETDIDSGSDPPEEPMDCERAAEDTETPQTLNLIFSGIVTTGGCDADTINGVEFEIPAAYPAAPGCEWRLDDIEGGPCGLTSIYAEILTTEWLVTFEFGAALVVFTAPVSGLFDMNEGRDFVYQSEVGAPADFTAAVLELFGGEI